MKRQFRQFCKGTFYLLIGEGSGSEKSNEALRLIVLCPALGIAQGEILSMKGWRPTFSRREKGSKILAMSVL